MGANSRWLPCLLTYLHYSLSTSLFPGTRYSRLIFYSPYPSSGVRRTVLRHQLMGGRCIHCYWVFIAIATAQDEYTWHSQLVSKHSGTSVPEGCLRSDLFKNWIIWWLIIQYQHEMVEVWLYHSHYKEPGFHGEKLIPGINVQGSMHSRSRSKAQLFYTL